MAPGSVTGHDLRVLDVDQQGGQAAEFRGDGDGRDTDTRTDTDGHGRTRTDTDEHGLRSSPQRRRGRRGERGQEEPERVWALEGNGRGLPGNTLLVDAESGIEAGWLSLADNLRVSFDADNAYYEGLIPVVGLETHPDFRPNNGTGVGVDDVGVLVLRPEDTDGISPATLPPVGYLDELRAQGLLRAG